MTGVTQFWVFGHFSMIFHFLPRSKDKCFLNSIIKLLNRFLAHLSQRLIGELIGYSWSGVRPSLTISNIFFSKTACPIKAKFYVEPPLVGGTKVCSRHLGHMTKMAAHPYMVKTLQKSSSPEPVC